MTKLLLSKSILIIVLLTILPVVALTQTEYRRAHLWEKEISAFAELDKKEFPRTNEILFVGSSSFRGWRTLKDDFPQFYIINRGFGGSHLEDLNYYADRIVFPYQPRLIVLYAGENDLVAGKPIEQVFQDFKKFVAKVEQKLPQTRLIIVSLKPSPARWQYTADFKEFNSLIKTETEKNKKLLYVDIWPAMLDTDGQPKKEIFLGDRLHLNAAGYKIWREALLVPLKSGLEGTFR